MPLIRYELGDLAAFGSPCPCGRTLATLARLDGRVVQLFRHPVTGERLGLVALPKTRAILGVDRWQVAQTGPYMFEVRVAQTAPFSSEVQREFLPAFHDALFPEAELRLVYGADLSPGRGDKFLEYRNEWQMP